MPWSVCCLIGLVAYEVVLPWRPCYIGSYAAWDATLVGGLYAAEDVVLPRMLVAFKNCDQTQMSAKVNIHPTLI